MRQCFITFRSITYAQRGAEVLHRGGIYAELGRTPRYLEKKGCGYSLRFRFDRAEAALALLRQERVSFGRLYCQNDRGALEAMP